MSTESRTVFEYHERTKHYPGKYARSAGHLDWDNEPHPFRRYKGTPLIDLPLTGGGDEKRYTDLFDRSRNDVQPITLGTIGRFLEFSMAISAWKAFEKNTWALRVNPSSGNLHPTEAHLVLPDVPDSGIDGGVYHYFPFSHALEPRASVDVTVWERLREHFGRQGFFVGLSSIAWREAWKYGERAFRYCNHDTGHALACLSLSASLLGWRVVYLNALSEEEIDRVLGFHKTNWLPFEREIAECLCYVCGQSDGKTPRDIPPYIIDSFGDLDFGGEPNALSGDHVDWDVIDGVARASAKRRTDASIFETPNRPYIERDIPGKGASEVILRRRSAQAYDRETTLDRDAFFSMLDRTIARSGASPFDLEQGPTSVHLLLYVHRVRGLDPGLYMLFRNDEDIDDFKGRCHGELLWERVGEAPDGLSLFCLDRGDYEVISKRVSCDQDIAADGVFSVSMIARFREPIEAQPSSYRTLHWETGMIGQVLYLEAEAHDLRGTGIGCFYDDLVHELIGLSGDAYQDLYHFTVGGAVEDRRVTSLPAYFHVKRGQSE